MISAPVWSRASTSASVGVMYTGLPGYSALTMPITGKATCRRMAAMSSTPLARMPTAPPSLAAWGHSGHHAPAVKGPPAGLGRETIIPR